MAKLPGPVQSVITSACDSGRKLAWNMQEDSTGTYVKLFWSAEDQIDFGGGTGEGEPASLPDSRRVDLCMELTDKAAEVQFDAKDGKPGLRCIQSHGNSLWVPVAAAGKPEPYAEASNYVVHITVQNRSTIQLGGSLPPTDQGKWTTKLTFPIPAGNIVRGVVKGDYGVKGSINLTNPQKLNEGFTICFHCLQTEGNEFKVDTGAGSIAGLDVMTTFYPFAERPLRCDLIIDDKK